MIGVDRDTLYNEFMVKGLTTWLELTQMIELGLLNLGENWENATSLLLSIWFLKV